MEGRMLVASLGIVLAEIAVIAVVGVIVWLIVKKRGK
jgi:hypothetical protein